MRLICYQHLLSFDNCERWDNIHNLCKHETLCIHVWYIFISKKQLVYFGITHLYSVSEIYQLTIFSGTLDMIFRYIANFRDILCTFSFAHKLHCINSSPWVYRSSIGYTLVYSVLYWYFLFVGIESDMFNVEKSHQL